MGGTLEVESLGPGLGCTFTLEVPLRVLRLADPSAPAPPPIVANGQADASGIRLVTADGELLSNPSFCASGQTEDGGIVLATADGVLLSHPSTSSTGPAGAVGIGLALTNGEQLDPPAMSGPAGVLGLTYASTSSPSSLDSLRRTSMLSAGDHSPAMSTVRLPPVAADPPPFDYPIHVLIVDDVASIRLLMGRVLKQHAPAAIISEACDGEAACTTMLSAMKSGSPLFSRGVICMDKEMPICDGYNATKRIRAMGFRGLILGVTGNAIVEDIAEFIAHGADAVITKPVSFHVLMSHIRTFASKSYLGFRPLTCDSSTSSTL